MGHCNVWNSHPKSYGPGSRTWLPCQPVMIGIIEYFNVDEINRVCGNPHGLIRKYVCRQCFRSNASEIGFIKYR